MTADQRLMGNQVRESAATARDYSWSLAIFLCLQAMDFFTTFAGFRMGLAEASPFVQHLMRLGPVAGVLGSKMIAVVLGGLCVWRGYLHVFRLINCWYTLLVGWNVLLILTRIA